MKGIVPPIKESVWFDIKNTGGTVWKKTGNNSLVFEIKNTSKVQLVGPTMVQDQVAPGETAHVTMTINVPAQEGLYSIQLKPKIGTNYLLPQSKNYFIRVTKSSGTTPIVTTPQQPNPSPSPVPAPSTSTSSTTLGETIRIALGYRGNPVITGNGPYRVESDGKVLQQLAQNQTVTVSYQNSQYSMKTPTQTFNVTTPPRFVPESN
jgi:hypothetical protein